MYRRHWDKPPEQTLDDNEVHKRPLVRLLPLPSIKTPAGAVTFAWLLRCHDSDFHSRVIQPCDSYPPRLTSVKQLSLPTHRLDMIGEIELDAVDQRPLSLIEDHGLLTDLAPHPAVESCQ